MGFIGKIWRRIKGSEPSELAFVHLAPVGGEQPIEGNKCYIEVYLESLRLTQARRLATRFDAVVYSFTTLARFGQANADLAAISKPDRLVELDEGSLDKVITVSKKMLGPVAWAGGTLGLEVGLFSVKKGNVVGTMLDYVTKVSATAGVSFVGAAKPFLPLITEGLDMLAGQTQDTEIEVALDTDLPLTRTGTIAIIDAPKHEIDASRLKIDPNDHKLLLDGKPLARGYCVLSIRVTRKKADFGEIPDLREAYAAFQAALRSNRMDDAKDAFTRYKLTTIASPDLIRDDAAGLVRLAEQQLNDAFGPGGESHLGVDARPMELKDLPLYG